MLKTYETTSGLLVRGDPIEPVQVIAQVWTHYTGGSVSKGEVVGFSNSVGEAEKLAVAAGFRLRRPGRLVGGVHFHWPALYVDVVEMDVAPEAGPPTLAEVAKAFAEAVSLDGSVTSTPRLRRTYRALLAALPK